VESSLFLISSYFWRYKCIMYDVGERLKIASNNAGLTIPDVFKKTGISKGNLNTFRK
jgi:hypothetical protein